MNSTASNWTDHFLYGLLLLFLIVITIALWRSHKSAEYEKFQLIDLVTSPGGLISRPALMEFGAFVIMTWGFVVLVSKDKLTEWYAMIYIGAFVMRAAYSSYLSSKKPPNGVQPQ